MSATNRDKSLERLQSVRDSWIGKEVYINTHFKQGVWKVAKVELDIVPYGECIDGIVGISKFKEEYVAHLYQKDEESRILGRINEVRETLDNLIKSEDMNELIRELWDV